MEFFEERKAVAQTMKKLYDRGLTTVSGGNISYRLNDELYCITPSALDKSCLKPEEIAIVGFNGKNYTPELKLSIESEMHHKILLKRPDINVIVHSHPVLCSAFSAIEKASINIKITAETYVLLKKLVNVPYKIMGSEDLSEIVSRYSLSYDCMLLQNHGVVALSKTLLNGFDKIDLLERSAEMTLAVNQLRNFGYKPENLTDKQMEDLDNF